MRTQPRTDTGGRQLIEKIHGRRSLTAPWRALSTLPDAILLCVGDRDALADFRFDALDPEDLARLVLAEFHQVSAIFRERQPALVVSPAIAARFDCVDLAQLLSFLDYRGPYRASYEGITRPQIVRAEIARLCPRLDFDLSAETLPDLLRHGA